jgi:hypothetical protein
VLGVLERGVHEREAIWRTNPGIEPAGLDIDATSGKPQAGGDVDL